LLKKLSDIEKLGHGRIKGNQHDGKNMSKGAIDGAFPSIRGWLFMYRKVHVEQSRTHDRNSILMKGLRTKAIESRDFQGVSHPFTDQMECIPLCVPRDQSHIG
jgi:hypothetical protein